MAKNLHLNISQAILPDVKVTAGIIPFQSKEELQALRSAHRDTHVFKRRVSETADEILVISLDGAKSKLATEYEEIPLHENLGLAATLVSEGIVRKFTSHQYTVLDFRPIKVITQYKEGDLLRDACAKLGLGNLALPDWLHVRQMLEFDVRIFEFKVSGAFVGVACGSRTHRTIDRTAAELLAAGIDLKGIYVSQKVEKSDQRLSLRDELLGRIASVNGNVLRLEDCKTETNEVNADEVWVEAKAEVFRRCLEKEFGLDGDRISKHLHYLQSQMRGGKSRFELMKKTVGSLSKMKIELLHGVSVSLGPIFNEASNDNFPEREWMPETLFIFDPAGQPQKYKTSGMDKQGPYLWSKFTPNSPRICVVCQRRRKGEVEQFVQKLLNGAPAGANGKNYFEKGFWNLYRFKQSKPEFFCADNDTPFAYRKAVQSALEAQDESNPWHLALVQMEHGTHVLKGDQNPYLITKSSFLSQQIPVQGFDVDTMAYRGGDLQFALSDMALACYAKLGGTPWVLQYDDTVAHELVIGLGSAIISGSRLSGERQRIVGITTVFTGGGLYLLGNTSRAVPFAEYQETLCETLKSTIDRVKQDRNWQKGEHVRLVFHAGFKRFNDDEVAAVKAATSSLTDDFEVEFAFLEVVDRHPFLLVDPDQKGVTDYRTISKDMKGVMAPARSLCLHLNGKESLLVLTGPKEVKKASDGLPQPVLLRLHRGSNFHDMTYLARQVFAFSDHSWKTFGASSMPVTISYSSTIARLLGNMDGLWNPDSILGKLRRSRWFL
jgi:hypothetical protein